jgi:hypothetical protein
MEGESVMLFGKKMYNFNNPTQKGGIIYGASRMLEKSAVALASLDTSNKEVVDLMEEECAKLINNNEDVQLVLRKISTKLAIDVGMVITPRFNARTLLIEDYTLAITNAQGVLCAAVVRKDMAELDSYLTEIAISNDEAKLKAFYDQLQKAYNQVVATK